MSCKAVSRHATRIVVSLAFCLAGPLQAETIPSAYHEIAIDTGIPSSVLYGVALAESGLKLKTGRIRPWPWTLNVAGVPRRYATRQACYKGLRFYLSHGVTSIDIGVMQVNWRYHRKKLVNPWRALDPVFNVRVGARILKDAYRKTKVWNKAIGRYHSPGQKSRQKKRAANYARRVMQHIRRINHKT